MSEKKKRKKRKKWCKKDDEIDRNEGKERNDKKY